MNPSKSPEDTLKAIFPIFLVLIVLIAGVIIMPSLSADPRSRASEPKKVLVTPSPANPRPTFTPQKNTIKPEVVCSDLYSPVCDTAKGLTYPNECEAVKAMATKLTKGECTKKGATVPRITVTLSPIISLPTSN